MQCIRIRELGCEHHLPGRLCPKMCIGYVEESPAVYIGTLADVEGQANATKVSSSAKKKV